MMTNTVHTLYNRQSDKWIVMHKKWNGTAKVVMEWNSKGGNGMEQQRW